MSDEKKETETVGRLIGYVRTEAGARDGDVQRWRLEKSGCELIYTDADASGNDKSRPELAEAMNQLRAGDTLVVWKWERLTLDVLHALELNDAAQKCGARLWSLCEPFDARTPTGKMLMSTAVSFAWYESVMGDKELSVPPYAPLRLGQMC
ncbi:recombinase family protein [Mycolicibacterium smegmatis]|uniref:recombinase family protein n=1 Tax=Mycolicibacterium smegmatis TaxID=1772 RepID=UPI0020A260D9|nr:recombinase family protein [Mycolicibacterium smegmatis]MCP2622058.1 recombinase family protein [Mycolicibacterium smegmatis]